MNDFLKITEIPIGSWWALADGGLYGYTVLPMEENDISRNEVKVLSTLGEIKYIDAFKLQYKYKRAIPNDNKTL